MSKLYTLVGRLWAWLLPRGAGRGARPPVLSPAERILQHREHLFGCAIQLLDDEGAAQQVVLEALTQAASSGLLPMPEAAATGGPPSEADSEERLLRWLERLVINLAVTRLKALSSVAVSRGAIHVQEQEGWPRDLDASGVSLDQAGPPGSASSSGALSGFAGAAGPGTAAGAGSSLSPAATPVPSATSGAVASAVFAVPGEQAQLQRTAHVLGQLPPETRVALMLVSMQGRTLPEVAELLGCSEVTCRFWVSHGLKVMRRALQRDLIEDDFVSKQSRLLLSPGAYNDLRRNKKAAARA